MKKVKCYHFCNKEFVDKLQTDKEVVANNNLNLPVRDEFIGEHYVKDYVFNRKKINDGKGMFFAWSNPSYKGEVIFSDDGPWYLLELEVDDELVIKTHYENWCSFGMDLEDNDGDLEEADIFCREMGIKDGLEGSYNAIFCTDNLEDEIQILLPKINVGWIKSIRGCKKKYI